MVTFHRPLFVLVHFTLVTPFRARLARSARARSPRGLGWLTALRRRFAAVRVSFRLIDMAPSCHLKQEFRGIILLTLPLC